jgi:hypothetical protein
MVPDYRPYCTAHTNASYIPVIVKKGLIPVFHNISTSTKLILVPVGDILF